MVEGMKTSCELVNKELENYKKYVNTQLQNIVSILKRCALGDFSHPAEIPDDDGFTDLYAGLNVLIDDINEWQKREHTARSYLENILTNTPGSLIVVNPDGKIDRVNQATLDLLGYKEQELIGEPIEKLMATTSADGASTVGSEMSFRRGELEKLMQSDSIKDIELNYIRKDNKEIPVNLSASIIRDKSGELQGFVCIAKDITEGKCAEEELKEYRDHLEELVEERTIELTKTNEQLQREITERKQAEEDLRENEERLRTVLEAVKDGITFSDESGHFEIFNSEMEKLTGYSMDEANASSDFNRLIYPDPEKRRQALDGLNKLSKPGDIYRTETMFRTKEGIDRNVLISTIVVLHKGEKMFLSAYHDITERKEMEEKYRDLIEKEKDIIYSLDDKGNITFASPAVETILGYQPEEVIGKNFMVLIQNEYQEKTGADFNNLLKTGEITAETVLLDKKKHPHFVEYSSTVIKESEKVVGTQGIIRDVTDRKQAENAIKKSTERYRELIEGSRDGYILTDMDNKIIEYNTMFKNMTGYTDEELKDKKLKDLTPREWYKKTEEINKQVLKNGYSEVYEKEIIRKDGRIIPVELRKYLIKEDGKSIPMNVSASSIYNNKRKNLQGIVIVARDLTETKKLINDLEEAKNELEDKVKERTRELEKANKELQVEIKERRKAEGIIKASLEEKELLLKEIHHRVKNNLQIVSSLLDLQAGDFKSKADIELFQESQNRIKSMSLIHEQLYQSKDLANIDFDKYIQNLIANVSRSYGVSSDNISIKTNVKDVYLSIDKAIPCGLIVSELVANSLKHGFSDDKKGEINIDFHLDKDNNYTFMVSDNGIGIPEDFSFQNTKSLGLRLVNMLTQQLKGSIKLDRTHGTTFKITFPGFKSEEGG